MNDEDNREETNVNDEDVPQSPGIEKREFLQFKELVEAAAQARAETEIARLNLSQKLVTDSEAYISASWEYEAAEMRRELLQKAAEMAKRELMNPGGEAGAALIRWDLVEWLTGRRSGG